MKRIIILFVWIIITHSMIYSQAPLNSDSLKEQYRIKHLKTGAFFGGGLSVGNFTAGLKKIFSAPVGYELNFDWYYDKLGWYLTFNIANFKNKLDTSYRGIKWPEKTKNFNMQFHGGFGAILSKTTYNRTIVKAGIGTYVIKPAELYDVSIPETRQIKLRSIPEISVGLTSDFGRFDHNFKKWPKAPLSFRFFYRFTFLIGNDNKQKFHGHLQNFGVLFGIGG